MFPYILYVLLAKDDIASYGLINITIDIIFDLDLLNGADNCMIITCILLHYILFVLYPREGICLHVFRRDKLILKGISHGISL